MAKYPNHVQGRVPRRHVCQVGSTSCHTTSIHVIRWRTVTTIFLLLLVDVQAWEYSNKANKKKKKKWRWLDHHHVTMTRPSRDTAFVLLNVSNRLYDSNIIIDKKLFYSWDFFHIRSQLSSRKIENILSHSTITFNRLQI